MSLLGARQAFAAAAEGLPLRLRRTGINLGLEARGAFVDVHPSPLLVLGNHKAGTTAITALLGRATGLPVTTELRRELTHASYVHLADGTLSMRELVQLNRAEFAKPVVKENHLTTFYPQLRAEFPSSRCLWIVRDPRDNIRSILNRLAIPGDRQQLTAGDLRGVPLVWRLVLNGTWLGLAGDNYIEMLATRWNATSLAAAADPAGVTLVRYEDFRADKVGVIRSTAAVLGLDAPHDFTAHLDTQYQPRGDHAVSWEQFYGPDNLARIERLCAPVLSRFGYA